MNITQLVQCEEMILKHWEPARSWPQEVIMDWVNWHDQRDLAPLALDKDGDVIAMSMIRAVDSKNEGQSDYQHYEHARLLWIDLVVNPTKDHRIMSFLWAQAKKRLPSRRFVAFARASDPFNVHLHSIEKINRHFVF